MNLVKLNELKNKLKKRYFWEKKKIYNTLSVLNDEELMYLFDDKIIIEIIKGINDYDFLLMIFSIVPAKIQELIWGNKKQQKILFLVNDKFERIMFTQSKEDLEENELYISEERIKKIEFLLKKVKSQKIIDCLVSNAYFLGYILHVKNIPEKLIKNIDIKTLYINIMNNFYDKLSMKTKRRWIYNMNLISTELFIPDDIRLFLPSEVNVSSKFSIIGMLRDKLFYLRNNKKVLNLDTESLSKLNVQELSELLNPAYQDVVLRAELFREIDNAIDEAIANDTILEKKFFDLNSISLELGYYIFDKVCTKTFKCSSNGSKIINLIFNYLFKNEYSEIEREQLCLAIENSFLNADKNSIINVFYQPTDIKSLFFLRFNICGRFMNYLNGIFEKQLIKINVRHINKLVSYLNDSTQDEISDIYGKAIKLYFVFGLEKACNILNGNYGKPPKIFFDNVSKLDVSGVVLVKEGKLYLPQLNEDFINFLFSNNKVIFKLLQEGNIINSGWYYLYNNFDEIREMCKGHIRLSQVEIILKENSNNIKYHLDPDCYALSNILYEVGLGNKTKQSNEEIYAELVKVYREQRKRIYSSIPYVSLVLPNNYRYEIMRMDDLVAYTLGYKANCCIRILDIAHNHLLHALLCENGRILIIYKPDGTIASFSPLKRNGELLIVNSIEKVSGDDAQILEAFMEAITALMDKTASTEEKIKVVCIGKESSLKPEGEMWPTNIKTPTILEKDDALYKDTDVYHRVLLIVKQSKGVELDKLVYGKLNQLYMDERKPMQVCTFSRDNYAEQYFALKKVDAIRFVNYHGKREEFKKSENYGINYIFYSDDWYVLVDYSGKLYYECLEYDFRAKNEMEATVEVIKSWINKKEGVKGLILTLNGKKVSN